MSKPHEETWTVNADGDEIRCGAQGHELFLMRPAGVAQRREITLLAVQAPKMARALLGLGYTVGKEWHSHLCQAANDAGPGRRHDTVVGCLASCRSLSALLTAAGVLP